MRPVLRIFSSSILQCVRYRSKNVNEEHYRETCGSTPINSVKKVSLQQQNCPDTLGFCRTNSRNDLYITCGLVPQYQQGSMRLHSKYRQTGTTTITVRRFVEPQQQESRQVWHHNNNCQTICGTTATGV